MIFQASSCKTIMEKRLCFHSFFLFVILQTKTYTKNIVVVSEKKDAKVSFFFRINFGMHLSYGNIIQAQIKYVDTAADDVATLNISCKQHK